MKKLIKQILKEEINNLNIKKYLDKLVSYLLNDLYIKEGQDGIVSFGSVGEMKDMNLFQDEVEILINDENEYRKLGWDSGEYEEEDELYNETYYFRIDKPDDHYSIDEFENEVVYDWLQSLYESGRLDYSSELGEYGEWILINKDYLLKSKSNTFSCGLWRNEIYQSYDTYNCNNTTNRVILMKDLVNVYGVESSEEMDYILKEFFILLPQKIESLGLKVSNGTKNNINESMIDDFIEYGKKELSLEDDFKINLVNHKDDDMETLGNYDVYSKEINVLSKNRAIPDIIRSIAHEMVHHKQNSRGDLKGRKEEGEDGSPWEDEANAKAGELVRKFGKQKPEIYDL